MKYRLPDWQGGHEVERIEEKHAAGGPVEVVLMRLVGGEYDGLVVAVLQADLVEVKPPAIDDPVELPLEIHLLQMKDQPQVTARIAAFAHDSAAYLTVLGNDGHEGFLEGLLSLEQCRDAARALWLLGTREATP